MHIQRRNPPARSDIADPEQLPVRGDMGDSKNSKESDLDRSSDTELEGDPIVAELRKLYEGVADEPLPDQLLELLRKLDEVERNR